MKSKTKYIKSCLIALILTTLAFSVIFAAVVFLRGAGRVHRVANTPPSVLVYAPATGEVIEAGDILLTYVVATSQYPIERVELWLDSALMETRNPDATLGEVTTFFVSAELQIEEGQHIFFARAVDAKGLVGQSLPVPLQGKLGVIEIIVEDGQTLEDIAAITGTDSNLLKEINPGLGDGGLPGGTGVIVPAPGEGQPGDSGAVIIPPAPLPVIPPPAPLPAAPGGVTILPIKPIPDIGNLLSILLSAMPKAPASLQAGFENCTVRLVWMDNADNETHFNVWMQALGGPPKVIATLTGSPRTGPAWYEFKSPGVGIYSFWVEAVNGLGGQSSEIAWVGVNDLSCDPGIATHLNIETTYMFVQGSYDRVYCYLSVEGTPEKRIPSDSSQFVPVSGGWGDISNWTGSGIGNGGNSFLLPEPVDGEVNLETTCLGWQGGSGPDNLGTFIANAPKETWDGRSLELQGAGYTIVYRIQPHGPWAANGSFTYVDYSLPLPYKPWVTVETSSNPLENDKLARRPTVHSNWVGDQSKLTGFTLFMNGTAIKTITNKIVAGNVISWYESVILPTSCGGVYKFEVAANSGEAMSALSAPYEHIQAPCTTYAEVKFETIALGCLDDGDIPVIPFIPMDCESGIGNKRDTIEAYYWINVNGEIINISPGDLTTEAYSFYELGFNSPQKNKYTSYDTFLVPIDPGNPSVWLRFMLKDKDPWYDPDDFICDISKEIRMPYDAWSGYDELFKLECHSRDGHGWVTVRVRGIDSLDNWRSANPGIGPPLGP